MLEAKTPQKAVENMRTIISEGLHAEHVYWTYANKDDVAVHTPLPPSDYPENSLAPKSCTVPPKKFKD